jgi:transposase-like protein
MWVGDASNDGHFALQWLREVQSAGLQRLDYACSNNTIRNHWPAIRNFFRSPYWGRVWILQEAISRDDSLIFYGEYAIT